MMENFRKSIQYYCVISRQKPFNQTILTKGPVIHADQNPQFPEHS